MFSMLRRLFVKDEKSVSFPLLVGDPVYVIVRCKDVYSTSSALCPFSCTCSAEDDCSLIHPESHVIISSVVDEIFCDAIRGWCYRFRNLDICPNLSDYGRVFFASYEAAEKGYEEQFVPKGWISKS